MRTKNISYLTLLMAISWGTASGQYQGPAIATATDMSFETSGTQNFYENIPNSFGWSMFKGDLDECISRTVSRNGCTLVGTSNNGNAGFATNIITPGVNNSSWNGEVHELWDDLGSMATSPCFTNNKYMTFQARQLATHPDAATVGMVHPLAYTMQAGDMLVWRGWHGWKRMTGALPGDFTFNVGLVPVGGDPLSPITSVIAAEGTFPGTFTMNWEQSVTSLTAPVACDRVVLYFKAVLPVGYCRFYLDDVNMSIVAFGPGMAPETTGRFIDAPISAKSANDEGTRDQLLAFPDPTNDVVNIATDGLSTSGQVEIYDPQGALVRRVRITSEPWLSIDLSDLPSAMYLLKYTDADRVRVTRVTKE